MTEPVDLEGRRLLVVEDEYMIAREIAQALRKHGAEVVGPVPTVEGALAALEQEAIDAALLDINLRGEMAYPVADALARRAVPTVFATGYDATSIPDCYAHVPRCDKPADVGVLIRALQDALAQARPDGGAAQGDYMVAPSTQGANSAAPKS